MKTKRLQSLIDFPLRDVLRGLVTSPIPSIGISIKWLLTNVLNLTATTGPSAVDGYAGVNRFPRIWDATSGLVLPAGGIAGNIPLSEGMRLSYDTDEEGVEIDTNLITPDTPTSLNEWVDDGGGVFSITNATGNQQIVYATVLTPGKPTEFSFDIISIGSGAIRPTASSTEGTNRIDIDTHKETLIPNGSSARFTAISGTTATIRVNYVSEVRPTFVNNTSSLFLAVTGDSIAAGGNTATPYLPAIYGGGPNANINAEIMFRMTQLPGGDVPYENHAKGTETFAWVASTGAVSAAATNAPAILVHCGVNDISAGRTWAAVEADLDTIKGLIGVNQTLFIDEILPWTNGNDSHAATVRTFNSNLAIWCAANSAVLISLHDTMGQIRVSTGELDDLKTEYDQDGIHLSQQGVDAVAQIWLTVLVAEYGPIEGFTTVNLTPTKQLAQFGVTSTVFLVYEPWTNGATVAAGGVLTDFSGVQCKYYSSILGGTTSGTGVADDTGVTDWVEQGNYNNIQKTKNGDGWLTHLLMEPVAVKEGLHSRDLTDVVWAKTTMTAARDQVGFDGEANAASSLLATAANATCLQTFTVAIDDFVASADVKRITGTGAVEFTVDGGTTWTDITSNLSTGQWFRAEATKNATNPVFGFRVVTDTDKIAVDFTGLEQGKLASSRIPTEAVSIQRNTTEFTATPSPLPANDFMVRGRFIANDVLRATNIFSVSVDANNHFEVWVATGAVRMRKRVGGSNLYTIIRNYSQTAGEATNWGIKIDSSGDDILSVNGVTISNADTTDLALAANLTIGTDADIAGTQNGGVVDTTINTDMTADNLEGDGPGTWYKGTQWSDPE